MIYTTDDGSRSVRIASPKSCDNRTATAAAESAGGGDYNADAHYRFIAAAYRSSVATKKKVTSAQPEPQREAAVRGAL